MFKLEIRLILWLKFSVPYSTLRSSHPTIMENMNQSWGGFSKIMLRMKQEWAKMKTTEWQDTLKNIGGACLCSYG